jgi:hypothetical protein
MTLQQWNGAGMLAIDNCLKGLTGQKRVVVLEGERI